jgi:hypothetical protein
VRERPWAGSQQPGAAPGRRHGAPFYSPPLSALRVVLVHLHDINWPSVRSLVVPFLFIYGEFNGRGHGHGAESLPSVLWPRASEGDVVVGCGRGAASPGQPSGRERSGRDRPHPGRRRPPRLYPGRSESAGSPTAPLSALRAPGRRRDHPAPRHHPGPGPAGTAPGRSARGPGSNRKDQRLILLPLMFLLRVIGHLVVARSRRYAE